MKKLNILPLLVTFIILISAFPSQAFENPIIESFNIPAGNYSHKDFPPCIQDVKLHDKMYEALMSAGWAGMQGGDFMVSPIAFSVGSFVTLFTGKGGDLGKLANELSGGDAAQCQSKCVTVPPEYIVQKVEVTNRNGQGNCGWNPGGSSHCQDWSGWRDMYQEVVEKDGVSGTLVCGTATNWSHDKESNAQMKIYWTKE